jgi:hypothetical protein
VTGVDVTAITGTRTLVITFSRELDSASTDPQDYRLLVNGEEQTLTDLFIANNTVVALLPDTPPVGTGTLTIYETADPTFTTPAEFINESPYDRAIAEATIVSATRTPATNQIVVTWSHAIPGNPPGTITSGDFTTTGGNPANNTGTGAIAHDPFANDLTITVGAITTTPTAYSFANTGAINFINAAATPGTKTGPIT